ncbi:MAG TPA: hypothetical protein PKI93_06740 [Alphaproteobacteria bacterium]|nr:hypothetical protein [Alphaproteobacteria bacterium]HNS45035.1 hypothetical protein [Alphaproteobacteria bacterium]
MQANLVRHIESIWSLIDVAAFHGNASFEIEDNNLLKRLECFGMRLDFINDELVRLRYRNLDIRVAHHDLSSYGPDSNVTAFPVSGPRVTYTQGDEEALAALCREVARLTPHRSAA